MNFIVVFFLVCIDIGFQRTGCPTHERQLAAKAFKTAQQACEFAASGGTVFEIGRSTGTMTEVRCVPQTFSVEPVRQ